MQKVVMQKAWVLSLLALVFVGGLVACGQKGPLYLPQQQSKPQAQPQPEAKTTPAEKPAPVVAPEPNTDPS